MRITIVTHVQQEGGSAFDTVIEQVACALKEGGHSVSVLGIHGDVVKLHSGLRRRKPDLIFNLLETFGDGELGAVGAVGLLDLFGLPYTGGGPGEVFLQEDKALTKKLLAYDQIPYPDFALISREADFETGGRLRMPLFVKPLRMDASIGIDAGSLVRTTGEMMDRVRLIHEKVGDAALIEEYIEGREFYIGVLGNVEPQVFPPIEMDFSGMPEGMPRVLDARAKWDEDSAEYKGTKAVVADLPDELRARLQKVALDAYRALRVRDYGRIDLRLTESGDVYVIEVNASCYLERSSEFVAAAQAAGIEYSALIGRIVDLALERHEKHKATPKKRSKKPQRLAV